MNSPADPGLFNFPVEILSMGLVLVGILLGWRLLRPGVGSDGGTASAVTARRTQTGIAVLLVYVMATPFLVFIVEREISLFSASVAPVAAVIWKLVKRRD